MNEYADTLQVALLGCQGGLAAVTGMLRAAGFIALVQNKPPAPCRSDTHCLQLGRVVPTAGAAVSLRLSHSGASPTLWLSQRVGGWFPRVLRTVAPQSLTDGGRKWRGWLGWEVPGEREVRRRARKAQKRGPEDAVEGRPAALAQHAVSRGGRNPEDPAPWPSWRRTGKSEETKQEKL